MDQIVNPSGKFRALLQKCLELCEKKLDRTAKTQQKCNEYRDKNPDNVLRVNAWQEDINNDVDETEYIKEALTEIFPILFEAEAKRQFLKGREFEKTDGKSPFISHFRNDQEKEALRHYSIAEQRLKDNI